MLTLHLPTAVRPDRTSGPADPADPGLRPGWALLVDGARIAALGPAEELRAAHGDRARVREWDGVLSPGRHEPAAAALLEAAYHPDPRELADLGVPDTTPLTGDALAALALDETRWGASARRGLQRLLVTGTTSLTGPFARPAVRTAVHRSGLPELPAPPTAPLTAGARADFAVLAADGTCLATALGGRLVHRRR
ncbi:hypothetical protein ACFV3R_27255 [Streptomyces sp. NPDC059740]|uniref:imidazolonepropionase-like domain-containing protein n=1 Tax=Streptomyces sp. NPDC059740 TaxID=3346926 RepID=UPI003662CEE3